MSDLIIDTGMPFQCCAPGCEEELLVPIDEDHRFFSEMNDWGYMFEFFLCPEHYIAYREDVRRMALKAGDPLSIAKDMSGFDRDMSDLLTPVQCDDQD